MSHFSPWRGSRRPGFADVGSKVLIRYYRVHTRQPPQRTQPKTNAGGTRKGQPHRGALNGYDAELAQRLRLGVGQWQAQRARFSAGLRVPRAATQ